MALHLRRHIYTGNANGLARDQSMKSDIRGEDIERYRKSGGRLLGSNAPDGSSASALK